MEIFFWILIIAIFAGVIAFFVKIFSHSTKTIIKQSETKERLEATITSNMKHVEGLPLAKGILTTVYYCPDKLVFSAGEQEFSLDKERISSISIASGSDISSQISGAAVGALLLGGLTGAAIGSLLGSSMYFIVIYDKEGETKSILLDTDASLNNAKKIKDAFLAEVNPDKKQIEL